MLRARSARGTLNAAAAVLVVADRRIAICRAHGIGHSMPVMLVARVNDAVHGAQRLCWLRRMDVALVPLHRPGCLPRAMA